MSSCGCGATVTTCPPRAPRALAPADHPGDRLWPGAHRTHVVRPTVPRCVAGTSASALANASCGHFLLRRPFRERYGTRRDGSDSLRTIATVLRLVAARPARDRGRRRAARGRHAQGDGAARVPRGRGRRAQPRHARRAALARLRDPSAPARRCGARSRRCAPRSAAAGSTSTATPSRSTGRRRARRRRVPPARAARRTDDLRRPRASAARRCDRGPFLAGFGLRDSAAFDDWQSLSAATARPRARRPCSTALADALAPRGDHARAIEHARRRLALDPLHEPAHRRLIAALRGERRAARPRSTQYRDCVRVLAPRARRAPLDETTALYRAVLEGSTAEPARRRPRRLARARGHPLVGRDARAGRAARGLRAPSAPDGRLVVLDGETGIGKTRLGDELVAEARDRRARRDRDALLRGGAGTRLRRRRSSCCAAALARRRRRTRSTPLRPPRPRGSLPELGTPPTRVARRPAARRRGSSTASAQALLDAARRRRARGRSSSTTCTGPTRRRSRLLLFLARRLAGRPLLLVVTWQPEETAARPSGSAACSPTRRRDGLGTSSSLGRLDRERRRASSSTPPGVGRARRRASSPRAAGCRSSSSSTSTRRSDEDATDWPLPAGVRELLEARLARARRARRRRSSRPPPCSAARSTPTRSATRAAAATRRSSPRVEELRRAGSSSRPTRATLEFRHEQERRVVYERTTLARRRLLHRRVAEALGARRTRRDRMRRSSRTTSASPAGEAEAADWFRVAGDQARGLYANAEALATTARRSRSASPTRRRCTRRSATCRRWPATTAPRSRATRRRRRSPAPERRRRGRAPDRPRPPAPRRVGARRRLVRARARRPATAPRPRARIVADRSLTAHRRGRDDEALALAQEALALAEAAGDRRARAQAHNILGILATGRGDRGRGAQAARAEPRARAAADDPAARAAALNNLALALPRRRRDSSARSS